MLSVGLTAGDPGSLDPTLSTRPPPSRSTARSASGSTTSTRAPGSSRSSQRRCPRFRPTSTPTRSRFARGSIFNDGTPFDAQAVVTSLERMLNDPGSTRASNYGPIDRDHRRRPYTVVIHVSSRFQPLLSDLATNDGIVMSPAQLQKLGDDFGTDPVCVGPFMFDHRVVGDNVTVIKSPVLLRPGRRPPRQDRLQARCPTRARRGGGAARPATSRCSTTLSPADLSAGNSSLRVIQAAASAGGHRDQHRKPERRRQPAVHRTSARRSRRARSLRQAFEEAIDRDAMNKVVFGGLDRRSCTPISPKSARLRAREMHAVRPGRREDRWSRSPASRTRPCTC